LLEGGFPVEGFCPDHSMIVKTVENLEKEVRTMTESQSKVITALDLNTAALQSQGKGPGWGVIFGAIIITALANADKLATFVQTAGRALGFGG
jgi:hypothetical protein